MKKILLSTTCAFFLFVACGGEDKQTSESIKNEESKIEKKAKDLQDEVFKSAKEVKEELVKEVEEKVKKFEEKTSQIKQKAYEASKQVEKKVEKLKEELPKKVQIAAKEPKINGKSLYAACSSCHGQSAEKQALGKSQIIKSWSKDKLLKALKGYKDGTYGGAMKAVMKGQVATKSEAQLEALSEYISKL